MFHNSLNVNNFNPKPLKEECNTQMKTLKMTQTLLCSDELKDNMAKQILDCPLNTSSGLLILLIERLVVKKHTHTKKNIPTCCTILPKRQTNRGTNKNPSHPAETPAMPDHLLRIHFFTEFGVSSPPQNSIKPTVHQ